jgi:hypothetical protein
MDATSIALNCAVLEDSFKKTAFDFLETQITNDMEKMIVLQAATLSFYVTMMLTVKMDPDEIIKVTKEGIIACREYEKNKGKKQ